MHLLALGLVGFVGSPPESQVEFLITIPGLMATMEDSASKRSLV